LFIILSATSKCKYSFLTKTIAEKVDKPGQKFLRQAVGATLLSGSVVVTDCCRRIYDDCFDIFYRVERLPNHLVSSRVDLAEAAKACNKSVCPYIQPGTPIIINLTDRLVACESG
jgi:hypothetical protein